MLVGQIVLKAAVNAHAALTFAVVNGVDGVVVGGGPALVEGRVGVEHSGGVLGVTVVHTGVPGVRVV